MIQRRISLVVALGAAVVACGSMNDEPVKQALSPVSRGVIPAHNFKPLSQRAASSVQGEGGGLTVQ